MNTYTTTFFAVCPNNDIRISYELTITTGRVIHVEDIVAEVETIKIGLHEDIADQLVANLGGAQVLKANHHGVHIETIRPHMAHWSKEP